MTKRPQLIWPAVILGIDLAGGAPEWVRAKALPKVQDGLVAAGYDVVPVPAALATCRELGCFHKIAAETHALSLVSVAITAIVLLATWLPTRRAVLIAPRDALWRD